MAEKGSFNDLTGQRFGQLVVKEFRRIIAGVGSEWLLECDCGNTRVAHVGELRSKRVTQCRECGQKRQKKASRNWARSFNKGVQK